MAKLSKQSAGQASRRQRSTARGGQAATAGSPSLGRIAPESVRAQRAAERRGAIVAAALEEFAARGFAATRLDDVAKRAGVAKGTIYLYFADKEALFQELVRASLLPTVSRLTAPLPEGVSVRQLLEGFADSFFRDIAQTRRGDIVRLIIAEGTRFPSLAEFHYRTVVEPGLAGLRRVIELGIARGEIPSAALAQFPQLVVAPAMLTVIWQALFGRFAPLDMQAMLQTQLDLIFGERT